MSGYVSYKICNHTKGIASIPPTCTSCMTEEIAELQRKLGVAVDLLKGCNSHKCSVCEECAEKVMAFLKTLENQNREGA